MWVAHALTLVRIPIALGFWLTYGDRAWSLAWLVLAVGSDGLDGWVARRVRPGGSRLGAVLDPIADKICVVGVVVAIAVHDRPAWWLLALIVARDLVIVPLAIGYRIAVAVRGAPPPVLRAAALGKLTTVAQFAAIGLLLFESRWTVVAAAIAAAAGLAAIAGYVARAVTARTAGDRATRSDP